MDLQQQLHPSLNPRGEQVINNGTNVYTICIPPLNEPIPSITFDQNISLVTHRSANKNGKSTRSIGTNDIFNYEALRLVPNPWGDHTRLEFYQMIREHTISQIGRSSLGKSLLDASMQTEDNALTVSPEICQTTISALAPVRYSSKMKIAIIFDPNVENSTFL